MTTSGAGGCPSPALVIAPGPRAALDELEREIARCGSSFGPPLRVVVPSGALRDHLRATLIARRGGRALAGVVIETLASLARTVLAASGSAVPAASAFFDLVVRRTAAREPALAAVLDAGPDAWRAVAATARDLVDAGLTAEAADALIEVLASTPASSPEARERAAAIVTATAAALASAETDMHGAIGPRGLRLAAAALALEIHGDRALPARGVVVFGFADVTGVVGAVIDALVKRFDARIILDRPALAGDDRASQRFTQRFASRVAFSALPVLSAPLATSAARVSYLVAPSPETEVRAVAESVRALLDADVAPESIGVVWRQPGTYQATLVRRHFTRLAIPFAAPGLVGPLAARARRAHALAALLGEGRRASIDRLLDASTSAKRSLLAPRVRLALRAAGASRVDEAARLDPASLTDRHGRIPLPQRRGHEVVEDLATGETHLRSRRSFLDRDALERAVALARGVIARLDAWPAAGFVEDHLSALDGLLRDELGWSDAAGGADNDGEREAFDACRTALEGLPEDVAITRDEAIVLFGDALASVGRDPLTGNNAGVRVLSATDARGQTFVHLFLLGVTRDAFPRSVNEDPLLPDSLRTSMLAILDDLPQKRLGYAEERHLFAQLLDAAPNVVVSWSRADERGRPLAPSPLAVLVEGLPGVTRLEPPAHDAPRPRTALEAALLSALAGDEPGTTALAAASPRATSVDALALANAGAAIAVEYDRPRGDDLGPYLGSIGAPHEAADARSGESSITFFERLARCPWQAFLTRHLGLAAPPDPQDALPGPDQRVLGIVVHAALAALVDARRGARPRTIDDARALAPVSLADADDAEIVDACTRAAHESAREEGLLASGFEELLAELAVPRVRRALALEVAPALASEIEGTVDVALADGRVRTLRFRADRFSRDGDGYVLVDFKTGKPLSTAKKAETRLTHLHDAIREGRALQAAAYARALPEGAAARYVHIRPEESDDAVVTLPAGDGEASALFDTTVATLIASLDAGEIPPRLFAPGDDREFEACAFCEVKAACRQGDSTARQRLQWWESAEERGDAPSHPAARALWDLLRKPAQAPRGQP